MAVAAFIVQESERERQVQRSLVGIRSETKAVTRPASALICWQRGGNSGEANDVRQLLAAQCVGQCIAVSVCECESVCSATNPISRFLCAFHSEVLGPEDEAVLCHLPFFYYINQLKQRTCNSFFSHCLALCAPVCVCVWLCV